MYLNRCNNKVSQKDIAKHFEISPAAVAVCLKKLQSEGYIKRSSSEDDSRYNEIEITEKGKNVVDYSRNVFEAIDTNTFKGISENERKILCEILDKVIVNLKELSGKEDIYE
jgi:DNA-binding MarR family transcriptional regulator